ncbi:electron transfer flavoprotein subunit beta [Snodgrassella communis]|uniref:Electron transfer flavoprotein subunit alpha n=1 Tax=Snodgrassella communis TaxID=2946699 RepID=A0A066TDW9_9NEIS|nr:FAD-binding protein [Snodgrassella communis]KDN11687.1 Electron transfer flavoprotein, alpha subunit [Snodgrassella communis]KDN14321.1 Electron transfer flavoprotein, alpha subunit [Snodgrassella communis]PIT10466.1 electron transfer flavoprotein subunit beta [Snodgrassella communis]PIT25552.1 electron transfer flavoprotein subunit beta [Snodgrassella communis]PIT30614.1 electron transfer flavoprotein subunit beta [Snodgrassella communis]
MSVLIIAEQQQSCLDEATLSAVSAGLQLGEVDILVAGHNVAEIAIQAQQIDGVRKVLLADATVYAHALAETLAPLVVQLADSYSHIVAAATSFGKNLLPRVAALLDCAPVSDVTSIVDTQTFIHPIYAGNVLQTVRSQQSKQLLTIRTTAFALAELTGGQAVIEHIAPVAVPQLSRFIDLQLTESEHPELTTAKIVISGGRGLGSAENFAALLNPLADTLNAAIGASRAAVDADYAPNDYQVGQTGKIVAPDLYIAIGISGAIQHLAGMKDSKVIVAINKDADAPIFKVADYGLVADLHTAVPELIQQIKAIAC